MNVSAGQDPGGRSAAGRLRAAIRGTVQGVGFRPFVYRLATELGLAGWIRNGPAGVELEVEGPPARLADFRRRLAEERPPHAMLQSVEVTELEPAGLTGFAIRESGGPGEPTALVLPDFAPCPECLRELFDPSDRRFRYPFINCTHCGPRYSIITALPYDRANTTMRGFPLCPRCRADYEAPADRRFHAEPVACPDCGPHVSLLAPDGRSLAERDAALHGAVAALREGKIVAVKGVGGFQLLTLAGRDASVVRLRERKHREAKPLAMMAPTFAAAAALAVIGPEEARLLRGAEAPIVLVRRRPGAAVAAAVAPENPWLGIMLPSSPLHHLLLAELGEAVVATSGNRSDEPIVTDEREAVVRLGGIADVLLVHDRPIVRPVDDSVARVVLGREMLLRRARGYAPLPVAVPAPLPRVLAVGAHLKSTAAIGVGTNVFVSQHVGDLDSPLALAAFERAAVDLEGLFAFAPEVVAHDLHPGYASTAWALRRPVRPLPVQHHYAHALAAMAENQVPAPALAVVWDGTGDGGDGTVWGGEFLAVETDGFRRVAALRGFPLPGGDAAVREPRRSALGLLWELLGEAAMRQEDLAPVRAFAPRDREVLATVLKRGVNAPRTTSAGRLFDAVASLAGLRQVSRFEGEAAMALEFALPETEGEERYPVDLKPVGSVLVVDWAPMIKRLLEDVRGGVAAPAIAGKFHAGLVEAITSVVNRLGPARVVLTGGCFQNTPLLTRAVRRLRGLGVKVAWPQRIPPNDGGIALGQAVAAGVLIAAGRYDDGGHTVRDEPPGRI